MADTAVEKPDRNTCPHVIKNLRLADEDPKSGDLSSQYTWIRCHTCGELFLLDRLVSYELPNSTARLLSITRALPGLSNDSRPLKDFLAPGVGLDWARVVQTPASQGVRVDDADEEPDLKWGHGPR